jgi:outer membrane protein assembly factor BamB
MMSNFAVPGFAAQPNTSSTVIVTPQAYDWPMLGHDPSHTSTMIGPGPFSNHKLNTKNLKGDVFTSAAAANGTIYVSGGGRTYALNSSNLKSFWTASVGLVSTAIASSGGRVYFGTTSGTVVALDGATGSTVWTLNVDSPVYSSPIVQGGELFVAAYNSTLYALNAETGKVNWKYITGGTIQSSPAANGVLVAIGSNDGAVNFVSEATGQQYWTLGSVGPVKSSIAFSSDIAYFGSNDSNVYGVDTATKARLWHYTTGGPVVATPVLAEGLVVVGSLDGNLYGLKSTNGNPMWVLATGAIDQPGAVAYASEINTQPTAIPEFYVPTISGTLFAVDVVSGAAMWTYALTGTNGGPAIVAYTKIYVGSGGGLVSELGYLRGATAAGTFTTGGVPDRVFQTTDTIRLASNTAWAEYGVGGAMVNVYDPSGNHILVNQTIIFAPGIKLYNFYYDYSLANAAPGRYRVVVWIEDGHSKEGSSNPRCCGWVFFRTSFVIV